MPLTVGAARSAGRDSPVTTEPGPSLAHPGLRPHQNVRLRPSPSGRLRRARGRRVGKHQDPIIAREAFASTTWTPFSASPNSASAATAHNNPGDEAIVRTVLSLASALDLKVVAEGVESGSALRLLRELGCDVLQGFFIGRPAPWQALDLDLGTLPSVEKRGSLRRLRPLAETAS